MILPCLHLVLRKRQRNAAMDASGRIMLPSVACLCLFPNLPVVVQGSAALFVKPERR